MRFDWVVSLAIDIGIADVPPLWLIFAILVLLAIGWWWFVHGDVDEFSSDSESSRLAIPYYVERAGLRNLAATFKVELPVAREVTRQRRRMLKYRGFGAERGQSETKQFSSDIDLSQLVQNLDDKVDYEACARDLGDAPMVEEREVLTEAIATLKRTVGETSQTRELLGQVENVYDREREETVVKQKRTELAAVGDGEKLILMRGKFNTTNVPGNGGGAIVLTHFDPPVYYRQYDVERVRERDPQAVPVPDGVGIRVALPDDEAFSPAGKERVTRGEPFYARVIAHSPSYNADTGVLTCAAYAVWGTNRPQRRREFYGC